ncbi:hypothetical protein CORMATOL_01653 [Corynebacterium matruchotii ATCC 33806]|uniref:Uncharacterized protein n=1 Tax=Corynebacterium matruchotii ATCC 33806 TaxID=566549 RepID=C0E3T7_9CORY|nr:hypothetical protein CORMATOL_01653 [Corynebacterium matruchotii ATCC 33806]
MMVSNVLKWDFVQEYVNYCSQKTQMTLCCIVMQVYSEKNLTIKNG